jgi:hypothetical protein
MERQIGQSQCASSPEGVERTRTTDMRSLRKLGRSLYDYFDDSPLIRLINSNEPLPPAVDAGGWPIFESEEERCM